MATTILSATGVTYPDSTTETTAGRAINSVPPVDIQTFTGTTASGGANGSGTWTKPTAGQTMAQIEMWGGGSGGQGNVAGAGGGYTIYHVPLVQLANTSYTVNAPNNYSSWNNGGGQQASVSGVTGAGWLAATGTVMRATPGSGGTAGSGYIFGPITNSGVTGGGASGAGAWGGAGAGSNGGSGSSPGGGGGRNGGAGGTIGGCVQVRITCW